MALKALVPIGIMAAAVGTLGHFTGMVGKKRQYVEHSHDWETGLKRIAGVLPPRTHIAPYIAAPHPALEGREIPIYASGALQSQIVPGGPLDPYANPYPTQAQIMKERERIKALGGPDMTQRQKDAEAAAAAPSAEPAEPSLWSRYFNLFTPASLTAGSPLLLKSGESVRDVEGFERWKVEQQLKANREVYRNAPVAEYMRIKAFAELHPELTLDEARIKTIDIEKKIYQY